MARRLCRSPRRAALRPRERDAARRARRRLRRRARPRRLGAGRHRVADGKIERHRPPGAETRCRMLDLAGGMVCRPSSTCHTHIDKGHIWPRKPNPDGTFIGALERGAARTARRAGARTTSRAAWISACAAPMRTAPRCSAPIIDSAPPQDEISWPVFAEMRERWTRPDRAAGRAPVRASTPSAIDGFADDLADTRRRGQGGVLGGVTYMVPGPRRRCSTDVRARR